jgi:hypothetical protein
VDWVLLFTNLTDRRVGGVTFEPVRGVLCAGGRIGVIVGKLEVNYVHMLI